MHGLLQALCDEHANTRRLLVAVEREAVRVAGGQAPDFDLLDAAFAYFRGFPVRQHHPTEEGLVERLAAADPAAAAGLGHLAGEHRALAEREAEVVRLLALARSEAEVDRRGFVRLLETFAADYRSHMDREVTVLFPAAGRCLAAADWQALAEGRPRDPLAAAAGGEDYRTLGAYVLELARESRLSME